MVQVSIITPCYNAEPFIGETIASVLAQSWTEWEWIITDDGSADRSCEIIAAVDDPRIRLVRFAENHGAAAAYNSSLAHARGAFITFIDSDDTWEPRFLEVMAGYLLDSGEELVYSGYTRCDESLRPRLRDFRARRDLNFRTLLHTNPLSTLSTMYDSRRVGKAWFKYDNKREDHAMWLSLLQRIPVGRALDRVLANYRMRPGSLSRDKWEMMRCQYGLYRDYLRLSRARSVYFTASWAAHGLLKYSL